MLNNKNTMPSVTNAVVNLFIFSLYTFSFCFSLALSLSPSLTLLFFSLNVLTTICYFNPSRQILFVSLYQHRPVDVHRHGCFIWSSFLFHCSFIYSHEIDELVNIFKILSLSQVIQHKFSRFLNGKLYNNFFEKISSLNFILVLWNFKNFSQIKELCKLISSLKIFSYKLV